MRIEYHKPPTSLKRRRAGFWLGAGHFFSAMVLTYVGTAVLTFVLGFILLVKLFCK